MLFVLTGDVQTGKTRWLERLVRELAAGGVPCEGVLAPGVWRDLEQAPAAHEAAGWAPDRAAGGAGRFEKLGIDNVLLPAGERVAFARRRDLAAAAGTYDEASQSGRAQLLWHISDDAIARVDAHLAALGAPAADGARPALLVVDELGRLELELDGGLRSAVQLVARGATARHPHALVVVRADLLPRARARFQAAWPDGLVALGPDGPSAALVRQAFGV